MRARYNALKGFEDILPPSSGLWKELEDKASRVFLSCGYNEIRVPIAESTDLFARSIGETSDIVSKEMYTFMDKGCRSMTLRPEGTAPVARAYVEHNLSILPPPQKFYYAGPMFRYERPQKGRQRQFHQVGVECFGAGAPEADAEVIYMLCRFLEAAGVRDFRLDVNSIGDDKCRPVFRQRLVEFFAPVKNELCPDCQRRYEQNPLRILDCKVPRCVELRANAPAITDSLCDECRAHYENVLGFLDTLGIKYNKNPLLVRGLDYYTRTTFEARSSLLGAQDAFAAGGRYDGLVEEFGGPSTPAVGFAVGMERLAGMLEGNAALPVMDAFIAYIGNGTPQRALKLAAGLRENGCRVELGFGGSLKSQLRKADKHGARFAFIIGEEELASGMVKWKDLKQHTSGETPERDAGLLLKT
ncbi:MAG: histidine--tRNA ligase [Nitrospiraceae bacterium]|nr:histidine--tRNA ligase [Nitrospiraceae bacterium]